MVCFFIISNYLINNNKINSNFFKDGPELFLKLLKIIPQVQEINRKHADTINALNLTS